MSRRLFANIISGTLAASAGAATMYVSIYHLSRPDNLLDWAVLVCSGLTVGIIVFFLTWGHFQKTSSPQEQ